jgi:peptidoglycan/xylan/chitin deacetylase (PgdA/CDA1 family)
MSLETFRRRLDAIVKFGFPVLDLGVAVEGMKNGSLPENSVVITIDDGFWATFDQALPALRTLNMPATVYVTSYHVEKATPVFELVVRYMQWKSGEGSIVDPAQLGMSEQASHARLDSDLLEKVVQFGKSLPSEAGRVSLTERLAEQLNFDLDGLRESRALNLASKEQIAEASQLGTDIQLHTRRHRFPENEALAKAEIIDNRDDLEPIVGKGLRHFCYPSGVWSRKVLPWLESEGIVTATTCDTGFNYRDSNPLALKRILDSESWSNLEFEAELSGFVEIFRYLKSKILTPTRD